MTDLSPTSQSDDRVDHEVSPIAPPSPPPRGAQEHHRDGANHSGKQQQPDDHLWPPLSTSDEVVTPSSGAPEAGRNKGGNQTQEAGEHSLSRSGATEAETGTVVPRLDINLEEKETTKSIPPQPTNSTRAMLPTANIMTIQVPDQDERVPNPEQRNVINPRSVHGTRLPGNLTFEEFVGCFFNDVSDDNFSYHSVKLRTKRHPDAALRRLGLIRQLGSSGVSTDLMFDERILRWRNIRTNEPEQKQSDEVEDREDHVPTGMICVTGTLTMKTFETAEEQEQKEEASKRSREEIRSFKEALKVRVQKERRETEVAAKLGAGSPDASKPTTLSYRELGLEGYQVTEFDADDFDVESIIDIGDPSNEFLSKGEILKYIKHYLSRSIIGAALQSGSSIICSGTDDISRLLARGYRCMADTAAAKPLRPSILSTLLVGVNPEDDEPFVQRFFSHQLFLRTDGGHKIGKAVSQSASADGPVTQQRLQCVNCGNKDIHPKNAFCYCPKDPLYETKYRHYGESAKCTHPPPEDISNFKLSLLQTLHQGYQRATDRTGSSQPPNRVGVPIVFILVGGDATAKYEVHRAVRKGWPVLVVEGSGGFADVITSMMNKVTEIAPDAGPDQFRDLFSYVDTVVSDIVNSGRLTIIRRGTEPQQFERLVANALRGDEVLGMAWETYSRWHHNEANWRFINQVSELSILSLSLGATLVSVVQTFLLLYWNDQGYTYTDYWTYGIVKKEEKGLYLFYTSLRWMIIALPIILTLLLAVRQRMNPWMKWVALRVAASSLLREIYVYRTRTLEYSDEAIRRQKLLQDKTKKLDAATKNYVEAKVNEMNDEKKSGGENGDEDPFEGLLTTTPLKPYQSREELLGQVMVNIRSQLAATDVSQTTLMDPSDETVPPRWVVQMGDDGMSDLTPDDYVEYRLGTQREIFEHSSRIFDRQLGFVSSTAYVWMTIGTTLAAMAALGLGYLQAWVSFATAVQNSLNRFLSVNRVDALTELHNSTVHKLKEVEDWWSAIGKQADMSKNRDKLVGETEGIIRDELEGWAKQLQKGNEEAEKAQEEARKSREQLRTIKAGEQQEQMQKMKNMGLDAFTEKGIQEALKDPKGPHGRKLKKQLLDLNDKMGGVIRSAATKEEIKNSFVQALGKSAIDARGGVALDTELQEAVDKAVPKSLEEKLNQIYVNGSYRIRSSVLLFGERAKFYRLAQRCFLPRCFSYRDVIIVFDIINTLAREAMWDLFTRIEALQIASQMVTATIIDEFEEEFPNIKVERILYNSFVWEMAMIIQSSKELEPSIVGRMLKNREVRALYTTNSTDLSEGKHILDYLRKRLSLHSPHFRILTAVSNAIAAELQQDILEQPVETIKFETGLEKLERLNVHFTNLTRYEIIEAFDPSIQHHLTELSDMQLVSYVQKLMVGTPAARAYHQQKGEILEIIPKKSKDLVLFTNPEFRERFVASSSTLTQLDVNIMKKGELMRAMKTVSIMTDSVCQVVEDTFSEAELRSVLSLFQVVFSNAFAAYCVDRICDRFTFLDLRTELSDAQKEAFVRAIGGLTYVASFSSLSQELLIQFIPTVSSREVVSTLHHIQIQRLYGGLRRLINNAYLLRVWHEVRKLKPSDKKDTLFQNVDDVAAQHFLFSVLHMSDADMKSLELSITVTQVIDYLGDPVVSESLHGICRDASQESEYCVELIEFLQDLYRQTRNCLRARIWANFVGEWEFALSHLKVNVIKSLHDVDRLLELSFIELSTLPPENMFEFISDFDDSIANLQPRDLPDLGVPFSTTEEWLRGLLIIVKIWFVQELPFDVFTEVCQWVRDFDLRDFFPEVVMRCRFAYFMLALIGSETGLALFRQSCSKLETDRKCVNKKSFLAEAEKLPAYNVGFFKCILTQVKLMTDDQVCTMLRSVAKLLLTGENMNLFSEIGKLIDALYQSQVILTQAEEGSSPVPRVSFELHESIARVAAAAWSDTIPPTELFQYDASSMAALGKAERTVVLATLFTDEDLCDVVAHFDDQQLKYFFLALNVNAAASKLMFEEHEKIATEEREAFKSTIDLANSTADGMYE